MSNVRDSLVGMIDRALGDDPRQALVAADQLAEEQRWLLQRAVALARRDGFDWGRIGRILGVTRQAARKRFGQAAPTMPPHVVERDRALREIRETERLIAAFRSRGRGWDDDPVAW